MQDITGPRWAEPRLCICDFYNKSHGANSNQSNAPSTNHGGLLFSHCGKICRHAEGQRAETNCSATPATNATDQCCLCMGKPGWSQHAWTAILSTLFAAPSANSSSLVWEPEHVEQPPPTGRTECDAVTEPSCVSSCSQCSSEYTKWHRCTHLLQQSPQCAHQFRFLT